MQLPISIGQNATIYDAIEKIIERNISGILVKDESGYGILSQKDIAKVLLEESRNIKDIRCSQKMQPLEAVDQFAPISNCASLMLTKKINMLGIKCGSQVKGVITKHDLVRYFCAHAKNTAKLADVMSIGSFFVHDATPLYDALLKMLDNQISRMLVKNQEGTPLGILTHKNFLNSTLYHANSYGDDVFATGFGRTHWVSEIMTKRIITVSTQANLLKVAKILIEHRVHGVAVTKNHDIVGFVTEKDIIRQISKMDW
ncbi:MAG TPA: CBS domain-containing protein [Candidatus Nitrosotenuis sp.]|nr:CBS domain-containing protein [Candidatus Nitrosotenuis sp.]